MLFVVTMPYHGVHTNKNGTFFVLCYFNGKYRRCGTYNTELEAAEAYDFYARQYPSKRRKLNFPEREINSCPAKRIRVIDRHEKIRHANNSKVTTNRKAQGQTRIKEANSVDNVLIPNLDSELFEVKRLHRARADLLVRPKGSVLWKQVQVKSTTKGVVPYVNKQYRFSQIKGYNGMLVVCLCTDENDFRIWCFNGKDVTHIKHVLNIKSGNCWDKLGRVNTWKELNDKVLACFGNDDFPWVSESEACTQLPSSQKISLYMRQEFEKLVSSFGWFVDNPEIENGHYTYLLNTSTNVLRVKAISCHNRPNKNGFLINPKQSAGLGTIAPLHGTNFEVLICYVQEGCRLTALFIFPAEVLKNKGITRSDTSPGIISMNILAPHHKVTKCTKHAWTQHFYCPCSDVARLKELLTL